MPQFKLNFRDGLALLIVILCFGYFYYISSARFPVTLLKDIGDIKIAMITIMTGVIGYYFGSSKKTEEQKP